MKVWKRTILTRNNLLNTFWFSHYSKDKQGFIYVMGQTNVITIMISVTQI